MHIPVLVVLGAEDDRILADRHRPVFESLEARGPDLTLWVIPALLRWCPGAAQLDLEPQRS